MDYLNVKGKPSFYGYDREISNGCLCPGWGVVRKNFGKGQGRQRGGSDCLAQQLGRKWEAGGRGGGRDLVAELGKAAGRATGDATC